ncbi:hypothetical protein GPA19_24490 [Azoarcus indigens]|uniref:imm11 family protein n=1 Tax=Azoarcus indigens TaxID=29545 RepID=UPI0010600D86|nr:DUF1629 domain-containing protein [Azoarcus indigens]NMG68096.1 hypothetical protein [Azoarcus indigens]
MSEGKFFRLLADPTATSRWYLKAPLDPFGNEIDPRLFTQGVPFDRQQLMSLPIRRAGNEVAFNLCDFDMVVTSAQVNAALESITGPAIQRIPVTVEGKSGFEILNVCDLLQCIDETRSLVTRWTDADGRPEKIGQLRMVAKLRIDPKAADGHHLFRVAGWPVALIASKEVKSIFEERKVSGVKYERVD